MPFPRLFSVLILCLPLLAPVACSQAAAIGNACSVGAPGDGLQITLSTPALECDGNVCAQIGAATPLCTGGCASDDDCGNLAPAAAGTCRRGFTCQPASPFGAHPCQRLCLCRDNLPAAAASACATTPR